jgi:hypothetical protein
MWRRKLMVIHWQLPPVQHNAVVWWMAIPLVRRNLLMINASCNYKEISTSNYVDFIARGKTVCSLFTTQNQQNTQHCSTDIFIIMSGWIHIIEANKMHYFSNLLWYTTLHVSDRLTVYHQESWYCIHSNWYLSYWLCWLSLVDSQHK